MDYIKMNEYMLLFSKYIENKYISTYDVILYNNQFYAGLDLFKNFTSYTTNQWKMPVLKLNSYNQAKTHFLNKN